MVVPTMGENFLPQESLFNPEKFIPRQVIPNIQSYPQVMDNSSVPLLKSISLKVTDPPTLMPLSLLIQYSPIVGQVLTFDVIESIHDQQTFGYPRIKDTSSVDRRPNDDATIEDVAEISSVAAFDDYVDIELALRNTNLDSCKDAFLPCACLRMIG